MRQRPTLEQLEPRLLYSADTPSALAGALVGTPDAEHRLLDAEGELAVQSAPQEIVFIDARTPDSAQLIEDITAQSGRDVEVIVLDAERNGLEQVSEALAGRENVAALHFIAHGGEGIMQLGNTLVTADSLERNPSLVAAWGEVLTLDADILLYGCDIAATAEGRLLADTLARLTGADVSASDDATGHASLDGDWNLEYTTGAIDVPVAPSANTQDAWSHLLPSVVLTSYEPLFANMTDELYEVSPSTSYVQSFTYTSGSGSYTVNQIDVVLYKNASATNGNITVELRATPSGGPALASGTVSFDSLGLSENWVSVSLDSTQTLSDGTTYYIRVAGGSGLGNVFVGIDDAGTYVGGNAIIGGTAEPAKDMAFRVVSTDGPVVDLNGSQQGQDESVTFTEQTPERIAPLGTLTDSNSTDLTSLTATLAARPDGDLVESLSLTTAANNAATSAGLTVTYTAATGVLSVTGTATVATYQTVLRGIQYSNTSDAPTTANRAVSVVVNDGSTDSAARTSVITVRAVNDAPVNNVPGAQTTNEDTALVFSTAGGNAIFITDDAGTNPIQVTLSATNGVITLASTTGLTFGPGDGTADVTMTVTGTVAAINAALDGMSFTPSPEFSGAASLSISTNDQGFTGVGGALTDLDTVAITVNLVNDAPIAGDDSYSVAEDGTLDTDALWFDSAWAYRRALSFDNTGQTENLTDFPVLVVLDASRIDYSQTQDSGQDLRFVDADGTVLAHEIEAWNESGTSYVWVKVPQVDGGSGSDFIWMYYGNAAAPDGQNAASVWSNDYQAVYHLDENPGANGTVFDSTGLFNATNSGSTDVGGYIASAQDFDGINDYVNLGTNRPFLNNASGATISLWMNADSNAGQVSLFGVSVGGAPSFISRATLDLDAGRVWLVGRSTDAETGRDLLTTPGLIGTGTWHYLTGVIDYANDTLAIYVDGVEVASASAVGFASPATPGTNSAQGAMGAQEGGSFGRFNGTLDEVSLADTVRSADWIAAQYASMSGAFVSYGAEQTSAGVLANDSDIEGDALTAILVSGPANAAFFSLDADGSFIYVPAADFYGVDTFTYTADDGTSNSAPATVTITVTPVNDAPVNNLPGAQATNEDTALVFSVGAGNAISIADVDAGAGPVQVSLTGTNGVITLAGTAGLSFSAGDGTADGTMTFSGTVAAINAALNGLSFLPSVDFNGAASLSINTNDQGNTGAGGALSDLDAVAITVNALNDAPVLAPAAPVFSPITEDQLANAGDSVATLLGASVSDVDAGALEGIAIIGLNSSNGTWQFSIDGGGSWSAVGAVSNTSALLLRDSDRLRFVPDGLNADAGTVSYRAWDRTSGTEGIKVDVSVNGGTSAFSTAADTASITVTAVNDAPTNATSGGQTTNEETTLVFSSGTGNAISIADVDASANPVQVTLSAANGVITLASTAGLSFSSGDGTADGTMTLSGTVVQINAALNGLSFTPDVNFNGAASLSINTNDQGNTGAGGALSDLDAVAITVNAVNDAPVNNLPGAQATNEDTALVFSVGAGNAISIADVDAGAGPVQVSLTGTNGVITLAGTAGLSFSAGDGTADGTMTFSGTVAAINAALNGLSFLPSVDFNGAASLSINTNDQGNTGAGGALSDLDAIAISVSAVNDAPALSAVQLTVSEGGTPLLAPADFSITDPDNGAFTYTVSAVAGGSFEVFNGATWNAAVSFTTAQVAAGQVRFVDDGDELAPSFSITANDGAANSATIAGTVSYTPVNDAPVNTVPSAQTGNEDSALVFSTGSGNAISVGDVDAGTSPLQVVLTGTNGAITLAGIAGLTFSVGDGVADSTMTFTGTAGAINAALNGLSFMPGANFSGAASLSISTNDQGNSGAGGALSDMDAVAITVLPNVAPTVSASGGTTVFTEGSNVASTPVVVDGAVTVSDPDSATLASATISIGAGWQAAEDALGFAGNPATMGNIAGSYNAATGVLSLSSAGATATLAQWQEALRAVVYTNTSDTPNTAARTVSFVVSGQGGTSAATSQQVAVAAMNDAPTLGASGGTTAFTGGGSPVVVDAALALNDVDNATLAGATVWIGGGFQAGQDVLGFSNDPLTMGNITGGYNAASGMLTLSSAGATATLSQWQAALRSVTYGNTSATPIVGMRSVSFDVSDGTAYALAAASHTVDVSPAPLPPDPGPPPVVPPPVVPPPVVIGPPPVTPPPTPAPQPTQPPAAPGRPAAGVEETPVQPVSVDIAERPHNPMAVVTTASASEVGTGPALRLAAYGTAVQGVEWTGGDLLGEAMRQGDTRANGLFQSGEKGRSAGEVELSEEIESLRETLREQDEIQSRGTVVLAAGSLSMTLAYLLWLIRGGALVASALSALPAWRILDPLPVLSRVNDDDEDEADEDDDQAIASFDDEPVGARQ